MTSSTPSPEISTPSSAFSLSIENIISPLRIVDAFSMSNSSAIDNKSAGLLPFSSAKDNEFSIV